MPRDRAVWGGRGARAGSDGLLAFHQSDWWGGYGSLWVHRDGWRIMLRANRYALAVSLEGEVLPTWERALHGCDVPLCVRVSVPGELALRHCVRRISARQLARLVRSQSNNGTLIRPFSSRSQGTVAIAASPKAAPLARAKAGRDLECGAA
jgi:hypothetical protein